MRRQPHRLGRIGQRHSFHLKENLTGPHHRDPMIRSAFALSHTGFSRLLRNRFVRKDADPDLSTALHETRHGHAAGFNLAVGDPSRLENFESEIPKGQRASAPRLAGHTPALLLAVLYFLWHQHKVSS